MFTKKFSIVLLMVIWLFFSHQRSFSEMVSLSRLARKNPEFIRFYQPTQIIVEAKIPSYQLPLDLSKTENFTQVSNLLGMSSEAQSLLSQNGFVVVKSNAQDDFVQSFKDLKHKGLPIFITTDALLHLYHIQFDETLRDIEEREFFNDLISITQVMLKKSDEQYHQYTGELKEAAKRNVAFFSVALKLLAPEEDIPTYIQDWVKQEFASIGTHRGFAKSPIFKYEEDYSQYVPRGHYTRSENLKKYFRAMMWYGRMSFILKGGEPFGQFAPCLISKTDAKIQTIQAILITIALEKLKSNERGLGDIWDRVYSVTAYYVGLADDLTFHHYREAVTKTFGYSFEISNLTNENKLFNLKLELAKLSAPAIYSGTGGSGIDLVKEGFKLTPAQLDSILDKTKGMRFIGQRYVPDSYLFSRLVAPNVGRLLGKECFTTVSIPGFGEVRGFPRGLDVMAVLGSVRAMEILSELGDNNYENYAHQFEMLQKEFSKFSKKEWNRNLYWSWLYTLKSILVTYSQGYQTFITNKAWQDKTLATCLGSWSALRHDTILYAKQSYTPLLITAVPPKPKPISQGYVEPAPEFYARLLTLTQMTTQGLEEMQVLNEIAKNRLLSLERILKALLEISLKELRNEELLPADYDFIANFGEKLEGAVMGVENKGMKTTMIADVHTDQNTKKVLEEGTGYVNLLVVAYLQPDNTTVIGVGPVFSYYEFKWPMEDRLTDEKWQEVLRQNITLNLPEWSKSFIR
ncbi:MAG: DUF3160 domain-containing protein [Candidatus Edwardsbacteria bacterium]